MKLGIVLEGGASRAYFTAGVLDFFLENDIKADYLIGASAGIANGLSYVSRQHGRNIEIGEKYLSDPRYMGFKHLLNFKNRSYYNIDFVFSGIPDKLVPFDYQAFIQSDCKTVAVITDVCSAKACYIEIDDYDKAKNAVIASCSLPILFQPVKIDDSLYLDGGVSDPVPVDKALEEGCDKIIVVTTREKHYRKNKETGLFVSSLLYRKYPEFVRILKLRTEIYNNAYDHLNALSKENKIFLISPDNTKEWRRTERETEKVRNMYLEGYNKAKKLYKELTEYLNY